MYDIPPLPAGCIEILRALSERSGFLPARELPPDENTRILQTYKLVGFRKVAGVLEADREKAVACWTLTVRGGDVLTDYDLRQRADEPERPADATPLGVSLLDAALVLNDGDECLARKKKKAWHNERTHNPPPEIGRCPDHAQVKLYAPSAICDWLEKIEGASLCDKHSLRKAMARVARLPQGDNPQE